MHPATVRDAPPVARFTLRSRRFLMADKTPKRPPKKKKPKKPTAA